MISKKLIRTAKNDTAVKLFLVSGMSYREFTDFWNMDHSTLVKLVNKEKQKEADKEKS